MRLLVLVHRLIVALRGRSANAVVLVKVHARVAAVFSRGNYPTSLLCGAYFVVSYIYFKKSLRRVHIRVVA